MTLMGAMAWVDNLYQISGFYMLKIYRPIAKPRNYAHLVRLLLSFMNIPFSFKSFKSNEKQIMLTLPSLRIEASSIIRVSCIFIKAPLTPLAHQYMSI